MNIIFGFSIIISIIILLFIDPNKVLSSFITGGENALNLTIKLAVIYAVWLGVFEIMDRSNLTKKIAKLLRPFNKFLFGELPNSANDFISLNISANILGISGATTPMGIKSVLELEKYKNTYYQICMFFVINATSVQIIPSSVLALRTKMGSNSPSDIILPTILATLLSSIIGIIMVKVFIKRKQ